MNEHSVFEQVSEDLLKDFTLEELLEAIGVEEQEVLESVLERYLYDPTMPAFIRARVIEFEEKQYNEEK